MKKLVEKIRKLTKNEEIFANFELQTLFQALQNTVDQFPRFNIQYSIEKNISIEKPNNKQQKWSTWTKNGLKQLSVCAIQSKTTFQSRKVIH